MLVLFTQGEIGLIGFSLFFFFLYILITNFFILFVIIRNNTLTGNLFEHIYANSTFPTTSYPNVVGKGEEKKEKREKYCREFTYFFFFFFFFFFKVHILTINYVDIPPIITLSKIVRLSFSPYSFLSSSLS